MTPTCNICGSSGKTKVYDAEIKLYQCLRCDHTFTLKDQKHNETDIYNDDYYDSAHKNWNIYPNYRLFQYIHRVIRERVKKHDFKLIDIGCSRGDLLGTLRRLEPDAELWGIDAAPCESKDFKFIQGDFMVADIKEKFDAVTSLQCIEHVSDPDSFVKKIRDMVLPEGVVVVSTINSGGMMYGAAKILNKIGIHSGYDRLYSEHHTHHFTNRSLRLVLEKNGFKIMSHRNHNYSLKSVDYPPGSPIIILLYRSLTAIIFFLSDIFRNGISQTVVCVPGKK